VAKITCDPAIYWHGNEKLLYDYIHRAAACGVDFFKLQLFNASHLATPKWKEKKAFFLNNQITNDILSRAKARIEEYGMQLTTTVNDTEVVKRIRDVDVRNIKIASGQIVESMIAAITEFKWKRIFVSTGMLKDTIPLQMITWLADVTEELIVYHCVSLYPTEYSEVNLNRIYALREYFKEYDNIEIGYSDHGYDTFACVMALGMGVSYIEKHFKIEGAFGPTCEEVSADEDEMAELCMMAKQQNKILGKETLAMHPREQENIDHYQGRFLI